MTITKIQNGTVDIALIESDKPLLTDVQSALDLIADVQYTTGCERMILAQSAVPDEFFDLRTKLAGEILQKFINYRMKLAVVGDFSKYESKSLRDFIYESNQGRNIFFSGSREEAIEKLTGA